MSQVLSLQQFRKKVQASTGEQGQQLQNLLSVSDYIVKLNGKFLFGSDKIGVPAAHQKLTYIKVKTLQKQGILRQVAEDQWRVNSDWRKKMNVVQAGTFIKKVVNA